MPISPAAALATIDAIVQHYATRLEATSDTPAALAELDNILRLVKSVDFTHADEKHLTPSHHPVVQQLQTRFNTPTASVADIFRAFQPILAELPWRFSYEPREDAPDIGQRMAWAELVGPIAPFKSDKVCLGLTAIGPHLRYKAHHHPAVETYVVVSGTAVWTANGVSHAQPPGALILHPSNIVHVMETGDEPLLAAYAWTGDVHTLSIWDAEQA